MASTNTTNMNLILPTVGSEPGPTWASDLNASLTLVDQHNHTSGYGVAIPPSGLNINADLPFNDNNATSLMSARFFVQSAVLAGGSDLGCLYVTGVDLYFNDVNGNHIRITQSGGVAGSPGSIGSLVAPASCTYVGGSATFVFQSAASTPANLDGGSLILRNILASSKGLTLAPPNAMGADYTLTLPSLPAQTNVVTLGSSGTIGSTTYDAVGQAMTSTGANAIAASRTRATGVTVSTGGVALSLTSGAFNTTSSSYVDITDVTVTITTSGRPVSIELVSSNDGFESQIRATTTTNTESQAALKLLRGATDCGRLAFDIVGASAGNHFIGLPPSSFKWIDAPAAGTYVYKLQGRSINGNGGLDINYVKLLAYEL